jgi:hypothetical protein
MYVQERYFRYCLTYYINIYVLCLKVVEVRSFRGAQSWWGRPLAYIGYLFIIYVI